MIQLLLLVSLNGFASSISKTSFPKIECDKRLQVYNKSCTEPLVKPSSLIFGQAHLYNKCTAEKIKKNIPIGITGIGKHKVPSVGLPLYSTRYEPFKEFTATVNFDNVVKQGNLEAHNLCVVTEVSGNLRDVMGYRQFNGTDVSKVIFWATYQQPKQIDLLIRTMDGYLVRCLEQPIGSKRDCKVYEGSKSKIELGELTTEDLERLRTGTTLKLIAGGKLQPPGDTEKETEALQ